MVVLTHLIPLAPTLHAVESADWPHSASAWEHWIAYTPLHFFWMGSEAVFVFFVLSGFVLALSARRFDGDTAGRREFLRAYYPSRLLRLYLPIWASFVLAWLLLQTVAHPERLTAQLPFVPEHHEFGAVARHATVLFGAGSMNLPLWSLQWELWFSLLLPAYLLVARSRPVSRYPSAPGRGRLIWPAAVVAGCFVLVAAGLRTGAPWLQFLPIFMLGVVLAYRRDEVRDFFETQRRRRAWCLPVLLVAALLLATARYTALGLFGPASPLVLLASVASVAGAALIVVVVLAWPSLDALLQRRWCRYLGERSFSLYLVHMPILTALTSALGTDRFWLLFALGLAASLLVAELFYRLVERPAHRLSRRVARASTRRAEAPTATAARPPGAVSPAGG